MSVLVSLAFAGVASAGSVRALTKAEYQQLQIAQRRIHSLESSASRGLAKTNAICTRMRDVSPLITAVRTGCLDLVRLGGDDGKLNTRATKCGIDPSSEAALLTCLLPAVQSYYVDAEAFYRAESHVNRLASRRGFSRSCVAVIGDSSANIAAEGRLAADLKAAVQALKSQNPQALETLSNQIRAAIDAIKPGPSSLALCPHA